MELPQSQPESDRLNPEQMALYDRQIRLWGLDAQKRIAQSSVLFVGLNGLSAEAAKNLLLAGAKRICICDENLEVSGNEIQVRRFLLLTSSSADDQTKPMINRIEEYFQRLNPTVKFELIQSIPSRLKNQFNVVCLCLRKPVDFVDSMETDCRKEDVKFIYAFTSGKHGILFNDLMLYNYSIQKVKVQDGNKNEFKKKSSADEPVEYEKRCLEFTTFKNAIQSGLSNYRTRQMKRLPRSALQFFCVSQFEREHGRLPNVEDVNSLTELWKKNFPEEFAVCDNEFGEWFNCDYFPTCAVMGGILSQEVTKVVSQIGQPIENLFAYDGNSCKGNVIKLGM